MHRTPSPHRPAVMLISCYELGQQPLGLSVPGGVLERAGVPVAYNDVSVEKLNKENVVTASFVGISTPMHTALRLGLSVARRVRELNPDAHICFYGLYAELNADYLRAHVADSCLGAECEADLLDLAQRVTATPAGAARRGLRPASGHGTRDSRRLDLTPHRGRLLSGTHYVQVDDGDGRRAVGYTTTTRGCKHTCRHCPLTPVYRGSFYAIPVESVIADITTLVGAGATHITFADPDFLNGPGHARRVATALHAHFPGLTFDYTAKVEHLAAEAGLVEELHALGNLFVVTALESLNDDVLRHLDKGHTRATALGVIRHFRSIGLTLRPTLVPFTPWETLDSFLMLLDTVASEGVVGNLDPVQYSIRLLVPPGSALLECEAMAPYLGALDAPNFSYAWTHPDRRMDALHKELVAIAEAGARADHAPPDTFLTIYRAALAAAGRAPDGATTAPPTATRAPGLTEAWFC